ncbi:hypothetical protein [Pseudoprimorskyibacter insulae]|uniref:Uncharacterized protein n=1 Tax=Pseudoprimorskyibacter insulae TaxID=1695997 RepID=A0A2R8AQJ1_9RHOB|nr:hypothetical protein [Pseudoprimorskyibacter insulae]SPF78094.1 hypothetical protein PRI8871_00685 [Pseudoprimorskyibacter insulae]
MTTEFTLRRLHSDIVATQVWLRNKYGPAFRMIVIDRHYSCAPDEIAYVVVYAADDNAPLRREMRAHATRILEARGWRLNPQPGRDVRDFEESDRWLSNHERLEILGQVEEWLKNK